MLIWFFLIMKKLSVTLGILHTATADIGSPAAVAPLIFEFLHEKLLFPIQIEADAFL